LLAPPLAAAQPAPPAPAPASASDVGAPPPEVAEQAAPDSPRVSVASYLDLTREGRYAEAAKYLDLPPNVHGPTLARRLKAVLDRHIWVNLEQLSPDPLGDLNDNLPPGVDEIARIPGPTGALEPIRIIRQSGSGGAHWVFTRATVERVDAWYDQLGRRWLLDNLPEPLLRPGPKDILWWQWLALPILGFFSWIVGRVLSAITRALFNRLTARTKTPWDDEILKRIGKPLTVAWAIALLYLVVPLLGLYRPAETFIDRALHVALFATFFWALLSSIEMATALLSQTPWAKAHPSSRSLIPLGGRVANVVILIIAVVAILSDLGYPVASIIAGLGVGGLAVALAAQKTVENLFGAFSIGVDQPFREGDFVKVEDFVGTVEAIGLRSTRIRTLDRTLITMPNGKLADMRLESFAARDRLRLFCTLGVVYDTDSAQMRQILEGLERVLRAHPKIWPEAVVVRFVSFGASSLDIEVMAWFMTTDWNEFTSIRQDVFLQFMEVVEKAGSSFAFPTRTLHLVNEGARPDVASN